MIDTILIGLVRGYQRFISPLMVPSCRFHPSCSEYARQAIIKYGVIKGLLKIFGRLGRCHPFHPGGYDPV
ncbi:membrane protein insertion efficiency factor YidD [Desulfuromonas sp. CSMB_57]|uniref:membrane protein insertion efficiency factor YidD n=1 Tax=Desulfuromonas sp. CSMB_57 TaxID=2807629 RepID=UPI001CD5F76C|nr:membrane protein insertion efficiency factor YidD [Desulfuromonas sp. CSMB_57]